MYTRITITLLIVISGFARAAEESSATSAPTTDDRPSITTRSGVTYDRCKVTRVEPDGISIFHSKGIAKIPFPDLPPEYQEKHGYDPDQAATYSQQAAEARRRAAAQRQAELEQQRTAAAKGQAAAPAEEPKFEYAGQFDVAQAQANIAKLNGKVIQLSFMSVADIIEAQDGYETTMFSSIFRSADSIGISARFPGLAAGWLSSLPKTKYRHEGRVSIGDVYEKQYAKGTTYSVFGKITGTGAIRLEPLGTKRTGNKYSW